MARRTTNRLEMRKQAEAAEAMEAEEPGADGDDDDVDLDFEADADVDADVDVDDDSGDDAPKKKRRAVKKKAKTPTTRVKRTKTKAIVRKRMLWGVFSPTMKEEGRFPYAEKEAAEARAEALRQKHKRDYFVQKIKEPVADAPPPTAESKTKASS